MPTIYERMNRLFAGDTPEKDPVETAFAERVAAFCGADVLCAEGTVTAPQNHPSQFCLRLLLNVDRAADDTVRALRTLPGAGLFGLPLSGRAYGEDFHALADRLIKDYTACAGISLAGIDEPFVTVYEWEACAIQRVYSDAIDDVQRLLFPYCGTTKRDMFGITDSRYEILCRNIADVLTVDKHSEEIRSKVYAAMKAHDRFDRLTPDKFFLSFHPESVLDPRQVSEWRQRCPFRF